MQPTRSRTTRTNGSSSQKMYAEIEAVKEGLGQLRTDVTELFDHALGVGRRGADAGAAELKQRVAGLRKQGADRVAEIEDKIAAHPIRSTLIAFGAGYLFAKFFSRR